MKEKILTFWKNLGGVTGILHLCVLGLSIFLIVGISKASFQTSVPFDQQINYLEIQWWVCIALMVIFLLEFILAKGKLHFLRYNLFFLLVSIPYTNVLPYMGWNLSANTIYLLGFIPLIRAAYAVAYVVGWFTYQRATKIFVTYFCTLLAVLYFGSLVFYVSEHGVNPLVKAYPDAVWWTAMEVTTVGCSIEAVTTTGKFLSFIVSVSGLLLIPLFTVYVQNLISVIRVKSSRDLHSHVDTSNVPKISEKTDSAQSKNNPSSTSSDANKS